jgi:hypothetical protein
VRRREREGGGGKKTIRALETGHTNINWYRYFAMCAVIRRVG